MNGGGMEVLRSLEEAKASGALRGCAVAIGNFDGVHLGHQRLLAVARERARSRRAQAVVLTFDPHPVRVLRPQLAPPLVTPLPRKLELLAAYGVDATVVQPFDLAYAATPAAGFVTRDLAGGLGCADVVVGYDFTAGHERARVEALRPLFARHGILLHVVEPVTADGVVARGAGRGRGLGFATANVATSGLLPLNGVYVVRATVGGAAPGRGAVHGGVCNVGVKPTLETDAKVVAEAHLLGFEGRDLYGEPIRVAFLARLRDERRFPSVDALRAQIAADVARARDVLAAGGM
jgi:riboflavin kinase / FMN adenylyltransferase